MPGRFQLKRMTNGWTISTRFGLKYILTNPMYQGHLVFNGRIVKYNAHSAIVDADNWNYAFDHLADLDLEGNEIERDKRTVRYTQKTRADSNALLAGTRHNGKLVVDGVNGSHVYVQMPGSMYIIKNMHGMSVYGFETSISVKELDAILEPRLLHWVGASERQAEYNKQHNVVSEHEISPHQAMGKIEQTVQPTSQTSVQDDLTLTKQKLASVQRALKFQDSMSDERLEETLTEEKRLIKRRAELEQVQAHGEQLAREREQAKDDIETAASKWSSWSIAKRRSFIRMVTDSITLEEIASGWLRLVIVWSPIMGLIVPLTSSTRATDTAYIWRQSGTVWTDEEKDTLRTMYPGSTRSELLHTFPSRSWLAIHAKAKRLKVRRMVASDETGIPSDTSLTDVNVLSEFMLDRKRVQWQHDYLTNGDGQL
jgi:SOS-response transcriptional repressor LexA